MAIRIRFFARFRELLGPDIMVQGKDGQCITGLVRDAAKENREGYDAIFNEKGHFHTFVIVMRNGKRVETADTETTCVTDGDEIAVFPPVAGG